MVIVLSKIFEYCICVAGSCFEKFTQNRIWILNARDAPNIRPDTGYLKKSDVH
jgi:hypothetical protein